MSLNIYKFFLNFYIFTGALVIKYDGKRFKVSKIQSVRIFLTLFSGLFIYLITIVMDFEVTKKGIPKIQETKFSNIFISIGWFVPMTLMTLILMTNIQISNEIAKILNIFLKYQNFFKNAGIDFENVSKKSLKYFLFSTPYYIMNMLAATLMVKSIYDLFICFIGISSVLCFLSITTTLNALLMHYEFMIENYLKMIKREVFECDHKHFEFVLYTVNIIFKLFKIFNQSVSKVISLCVLFILHVLVFIVSCSKY